jgi:hypothetical protein
LLTSVANVVLVQEESVTAAATLPEMVAEVPVAPLFVSVAMTANE